MACWIRGPRHTLNCCSLSLPLAWNLQQEQQLAQQKDMDGKSSAWKAYMAQVKAYEARNCTEQDGYKRPLVK